MKTTAILVAIAMIAMATPTQAIDPKIETVDNTEFFKMITLKAHENSDLATPAPTFEEEKWDDLFAALNERANGRDLMAQFEGSEDTGAFPQVSEWFELYEVAISTSNLCPAPAVSEADPLAGTHSWSPYAIGEERVGVATSDVSTVSGIGFFFDYINGKGFAYSQAVTYAGASDFYCTGIDFFGVFYTYNWPYASGVAADGI